MSLAHLFGVAGAVGAQDVFMNGTQESWWSNREKVNGLGGQDLPARGSPTLLSVGVRTLLAGGIVLVGHVACSKMPERLKIFECAVVVSPDNVGGCNSFLSTETDVNQNIALIQL